MGEKAYNTMKNSGAWSIALGIVLMVVGLASGIMLVVSGGKLIRDKKEILL